MNEKYKDINIERLYFNEISKTEIFTKEEEEECIDKILNGDEQAKEELIRRNLRLVVSIARKYNGKGLSILDLVQEGNLGLMKAVEKYDKSFNTRFSTYASIWIKQYLSRAVYSKSRNIRLPESNIIELQKYKRVYSELKSSLGRTPTYDEVLIELNTNWEKLSEILEFEKDTLSINMCIGEESDETFEEVIQSDEISLEDKYINKELKNNIKKLFDDAKLNEHQKEVLDLRYGLTDGVRMSYVNIAKKLNLTKQRIQQIELSATKKLILSEHIDAFTEYMSNPETAQKYIDDKRSQIKDINFIYKNKIFNKK